METQNTIPQPATDYLARLVDFRKRAYASDCVTRWESAQPFATSWPNLKAEYVDDIAKKLGRYLSPKGGKPVSAPSPVEKWVAEVVEPAAIIKCDECSQAIRTSEIIDGKCPNPACWKGYAAYCAAYRGWHAASEAFVKAHNAAGYGQAGRLAHNAWLTRNPEPKADHFRDGKRPTYPAWEVANVETKEQREARLLAEKWANPTIITLPHGEARILASVPEQQRLKLESEIAKVVTNRKTDERPGYMKGRAYIGNAAPHRAMVQKAIDATLGITDQSNWRTIGKPIFTGLFTETMGGRKWLDVVAEMQGPHYRGWQPEDPTPDAVRPFPTMNIVQPETYAEAAG